MIEIVFNPENQTRRKLQNKKLLYQMMMSQGIEGFTKVVTNHGCTDNVLIFEHLRDGVM